MPAISLRNLALLGAAGAALALSAVPVAQSQSRSIASPSLVPVGVSASGSTSTAWFHDPSTGRAIACQTVMGAQGTPTGVHCVAGKLPQEGA